MGQRTIERMEKEKEKEKDKSSEPRSSGSVGSVMQGGGTPGYERGQLIDKRMKRMSPHIDVQRSRIGSPVIGGDMDFEVAETYSVSSSTNWIGAMTVS